MREMRAHETHGDYRDCVLVLLYKLCYIVDSNIWVSIANLGEEETVLGFPSMHLDPGL